MEMRSPRTSGISAQCDHIPAVHFEFAGRDFNINRIGLSKVLFLFHILRNVIPEFFKMAVSRSCIVGMLNKDKLSVTGRRNLDPGNETVSAGMHRNPGSVLRFEIYAGMKMVGTKLSKVTTDGN